MDCWKEYRDGKLTPPCVIQHDEINKEHLIWVWTGKAILGPFSRTVYDEKEILACAMEAENFVPMPESPAAGTYTKDEIELILKEKGYLETTEKLEDLKEASVFVDEKSKMTEEKG